MVNSPELEGRQEVAGDTVLEDDRFYDDEDGPWYFGKAREEYSRKQQSRQTREGSETDDPVEVLTLRILSSGLAKQGEV